MNKEDLKNRFKIETGLDVSSGVLTYSVSYVEWLEKQLLIHSVVVPKGTLCDLDGKQVMVRFKVTKHIPKIVIDDI